ncbi:YbaB/EbfC family nucleoid-associated protein [Actinophytocola sp.]|uniref:YbaB/EbfC family nucleoid-associated protein n=1 Tax=Actinophytocola sp. TaxID=1872138 RepID=UPI002D80632B|nr:YbaB/EbfC family nucleoid-associated protein [Actinophytocola sp.]HET9140824.1 YbaB/EbfC family nucleoid-associated protein [Actinophytocola sp.]
MRTDQHHDVDLSADVAGIMARVQEQQDAVERVQRDVEIMRVTGRSRSNEVVATILGTGRFTAIDIDPDTIRRHDPYDLGAIVLEAVNDAVTRLAEATSALYAPILDAALPDRWDRE